jgi:hypothetical protein
MNLEYTVTEILAFQNCFIAPFQKSAHAQETPLYFLLFMYNIESIPMCRKNLPGW